MLKDYPGQGQQQPEPQSHFKEFQHGFLRGMISLKLRMDLAF